MAANFSGCLENLFFNDTNVIHELRHQDDRSLIYTRFGQVLYNCRVSRTPSGKFRNAANTIAGGKDGGGERRIADSRISDPWRKNKSEDGGRAGNESRRKVGLVHFDATL